MITDIHKLLDKIFSPFKKSSSLVMSAPMADQGQEPGVYIGAFTDPDTGEIEWMRDCSDRHVLLAAPTRCMDGTTEVLLADGSQATLEELHKRFHTGERFKVLTVDIGSGERVEAICDDVMNQGRKQTTRVTFSNGKSIIATPEHRLLLHDRSFCTVDQVRSGTALYSHDGTEIVVMSKVPAGVRQVYDLSVPGYENYCLAAGITTHNSGKGVSFAVPNVLTYPESMVIHDLKGELWAISARYRRDHLHNLVFRFDPTCDDGTGACFNPLDEVRLRTDYEVQDAANISTLIVDPDGKAFTGENAHWARTARSFLTSVILHVLYCEPDKTLRGLDAFLSNEKKTSDEVFREMLTAIHDPDHKRGWIDADGNKTGTMKEIAMAARDMLERPDGERGSVMSAVKSYLDVYRDPIIARNTCRSDFSIQDLMKNDSPVTLYIVNNPSDMDRVQPLIRLIFNFVMRGFTRSLQFDDKGRPIKAYKHPLLLLMDEFSSLGNLSIFASALSFVAGYGIRVMVIVQDFAQLVERYQDPGARGLMANMHIKIYYAPGDPSTAKLFSDSFGSMTHRHQSVSIDSRGKRSYTEHLEQRPMLTPDEFMALGRDKAVIAITGEPPIACGRIVYYEEPLFQRRVLAQPTSSDKIPTELQAGQVQNRALREKAEREAQVRIAQAEQARLERERAASQATSVSETLVDQLSQVDDPDVDEGYL
jgi:type IV secretory pathway TraG/TraD family ATPase VirD4